MKVAPMLTLVFTDYLGGNFLVTNLMRPLRTVCFQVTWHQEQVQTVFSWTKATTFVAC